VQFNEIELEAAEIKANGLGQARSEVNKRFVEASKLQSYTKMEKPNKHCGICEFSR